ncbi:MAG: hypothetical protein E8D49_13185 [Nitrospira sp.]|nr:MAG: hypothetical protein E8D49_13185 [Nitrospira sp.]
MRRNTTKVSLLLFLIALTACDQGVYLPDEIKAEKEFLAVSVGVTEHELKRQLGEPMGIVVGMEKGRYKYTKPLEGSLELEFYIDKFHGKSTPELRFLSNVDQGQRILVYLSGTVHGYFYFDAGGRLIKKEATIS